VQDDVVAEPTQTFSEISPAERAWIDEHLARAAEAGATVPDLASVSRLFDEAYEGVRSGAVPPEAANDVVNTVGVLVGEHLCRSAGMAWAIVVDEYGTDLCVRDPHSSTVLFPQSSAAKRWEAGELGWVEPFTAWARGHVAEARGTTRN